MTSVTQTVEGVVTKVSSAQTVRVETKVTKVHPIYKKRFTRTRHYVVHNPDSDAKVGDIVTIVPCKPISKNKHWITRTVETAA